MNKTQRVKQAIATGDWSVAIKIAATFRVGFTRDEMRAMQIAKDCITGKSGFYKQLGIDTDGMINKSITIISNKYA